MIELHTLTPIDGHNRFTFEETDPAQRRKLAEHIEGILKLGHDVFVENKDGTFRVSGYDAEKNEWILKKPKGRPRTKVAAAESKASEVPPRAGG